MLEYSLLIIFGEGGLLAKELQLFSFLPNVKKFENELLSLNDETVNYGLRLSQKEVKDLIEVRNEALKDSGRIEFGLGAVERIITYFCDSPYISQDSYALIIGELTEMFYNAKTETLDSVSDDELLRVMKEAFDGPCAGSTELLRSRELDAFIRACRFHVYGIKGSYDNNSEYTKTKGEVKFDE